MSAAILERIEHYWSIGNGIDQARRNLAIRDGIHLGFHDLHPVFVRLANGGRA